MFFCKKDDFETFNNTSENGSNNRSSKQAETELHFEYRNI